MAFSTYLSFSSLYEIEQASLASPINLSRSSTQSSEYPRRGATSTGGVLRRDSNSSTSSKSSSSSADSDRRVHFASSSSASSSSTSLSSSIYQSHSDSLHSHSKRYSTEDGSLPSARLQHLSEEQDLSLKRFGRR